MQPYLSPRRFYGGIDALLAVPALVPLGHHEVVRVHRDHLAAGVRCPTLDTRGLARAVWAVRHATPPIIGRPQVNVAVVRRLTVLDVQLFASIGVLGLHPLSDLLLVGISPAPATRTLTVGVRKSTPSPLLRLGSAFGWGPRGWRRTRKVLRTRESGRQIKPEVDIQLELLA